MKGRLIISISTTILEEAAILAAGLWLLPKWNIHIPLWGLLIIMVIWAAYAIFTHRAGTRALKSKQVTGLLNMIGCKGKVVNPLTPEGMVRINGEIWNARTTGSEMTRGEEVTVVGQDRLTLVVKKSDSTDNPDNN